MNIDDVIAKVRRLYALAESSSSEHEAGAAIAAAERLIQSYRLSAADLESGTQATAVLEEEPLDHLSSRPATWLRALTAGLAAHYGCATFREPLYGSTFEAHPKLVGWRSRVAGRPDDVRLFRLQYDRIKAQIERLAVANCKGRGRSYADSYRKGLVTTVRQRLQDARTEARATATTQAIVRVDARADEAKSAVEAECPGIKTTNLKSEVTNGAAYQRGREDGQHIHLGEELGPGKPVAALPGKVSA